MQSPIKYKTAYIGVLLAFCLVLSYIESLIPLPIPVPGIKIGLSNLPVLVCLILFGPLYGIGLAIVKAVLCSLLFGNFNVLMYSLAGAILSSVAMSLLLKIKSIHLPVISGCGGVFHNIGQFLVAYIILKSKGLFYYFPFLIIAGLFTGLLLGFIVSIIVVPIKKALIKGVD